MHDRHHTIMKHRSTSIQSNMLLSTCCFFVLESWGVACHSLGGKTTGYLLYERCLRKVLGINEREMREETGHPLSIITPFCEPNAELPWGILLESSFWGPPGRRRWGRLKTRGGWLGGTFVSFEDLNSPLLMRLFQQKRLEIFPLGSQSLALALTFGIRASKKRRTSTRGFRITSPSQLITRTRCFPVFFPSSSSFFFGQWFLGSHALQYTGSSSSSGISSLN